MVGAVEHLYTALAYPDPSQTAKHSARARRQCIA